MNVVLTRKVAENLRLTLRVPQQDYNLNGHVRASNLLKNDAGTVAAKAEINYA